MPGKKHALLILNGQNYTGHCQGGFDTSACVCSHTCTAGNVGQVLASRRKNFMLGSVQHCI